jgi:hypothetical protein
MKGGGCNMKKKLLAVLSLVMVLAMESVTVFATEGAPSPNSGNVLYGSVADTIATTTEQVAEVKTTVTAKLEVKETTTNADGSKTTTLGSGLKDANGVEKTVAVTEKTDGTIAVATSTGTTTTFKEAAGSNVIQSTSSKEVAQIAPADTMTKFGALTNDAKVEAVAKAADVVENLQQTTGASADSVSIFEATGDVDENGGWNLSVAGAKVGDPYLVLHNRNGVWVQCEATINAAGNLYIISGSKSPFIVIKLDKAVSGITSTSATTEADYTTQSVTNTVSGDVSPKTADAYPYAATIAAISIIAIAVCGKKRISR